jgi:hypothetical protein
MAKIIWLNDQPRMRRDVLNDMLETAIKDSIKHKKNLKLATCIAIFFAIINLGDLIVRHL